MKDRLRELADVNIDHLVQTFQIAEMEYSEQMAAKGFLFDPALAVDSALRVTIDTLLAILDAEGDGGAVAWPDLWIEFTDDGHNIRLWTRNEQQAAEEIREGRKLLGFYSRAPFTVLNEQSGNSGQLEFQKGVLEGLSIAKTECDRRVFALDGGDNKFRREASASQCAEALRRVYVRIFREIYPLPVIGIGDALQTVESWAMSGGELCGDDVPRFRDLIDRIAPIANPARSGVVSDEDVRDGARLDWLLAHRNYRVQENEESGWCVMDCGNGLSFVVRHAPTAREAIDAAIQGERHER